MWLSEPLLMLGLLGLLGNGLTRRLPYSQRSPWIVFWLCILAAVWIGHTSQELIQKLSSLASFGPVALNLIEPYAIATSLLLGLLLLLGRARGQVAGEVLPLTLLLPCLLALLVLANPGGDSLTLLPLLAATGLAPHGDEFPPSDDAIAETWQKGPSLVVEMVSLQTVGWGLVLALTAFFTELWRQQVLSALMMGFGTGFSAWLLSGILWGLAQNLGSGRLRVVAIARFVFGSRVVPNP
jgi:hypothetical protein